MFHQQTRLAMVPFWKLVIFSKDQIGSLTEMLETVKEEIENPPDEDDEEDDDEDA